MQTWESLTTYKEASPEQLERALKFAVSQVENNLAQFTTKFPASSSENNRYPASDNVEWTTGFWTGQIWLAYEVTGKDLFRRAGNVQVDSFLDRIIGKVDVNHHDMGFLYSPSCVASYLLTGNETARTAALLAAGNLLERFHESGRFFQAWGELGASENYRFIIDCLLNMPLLFWASEQTGNREYEQKARQHIMTAMKHLVRDDYSTYHTYYFDPDTGKPVKGVTHQGYRDGSAWSRGQAWGIYGSALAYKYMGKYEYLELFEAITGYFLRHLPADLIPYWDFDFDDGSNEPRDSSSLAIAICGILEMVGCLEPGPGQTYFALARRLMNALIEQCSVTSAKLSDGLLLHGTYARGSLYNPCADRGVDECNTWGDFYYLEGLVRLTRTWKPYW